MTSTSSATATALPDRRHFLSTLASASALGLPALPVLAASASADAALIDLAGRLATAMTILDELDERCDEAYDRFVAPNVPEALFWRKSDFPAVWVDQTRLNSLGNPDDGTERYVYETEEVLQSLEAKRAEWLAVDRIDRCVGDCSVARVEEIITHLRAYLAEEKQCLTKCGFTAASEAEHAQYRAVFDLQEQIASIPAQSAEGVCVKVRAALGRRDADEVQRHFVAGLLAKPDRRPDETKEMLLWAAMVDAAHIHANDDRRAA